MGNGGTLELPDASANDARLPPQVHPVLLDTEITDDSPGPAYLLAYR